MSKVLPSTGIDIVKDGDSTMHFRSFPEALEIMIYTEQGRPNIMRCLDPDHRAALANLLAEFADRNSSETDSSEPVDGLHAEVKKLKIELEQRFVEINHLKGKLHNAEKRIQDLVERNDSQFDLLSEKNGIIKELEEKHRRATIRIKELAAEQKADVADACKCHSCRVISVHNARNRGN